MTEFQKQIQQLAREHFDKQLLEWIKEASRKDMNSVEALKDLLGRVFIRGVTIGIELGQKIHKGEL